MKIGFSFSGRTIDYFGSDSISSDGTAIFELIKNSRDANAKKIEIKFKNVGKTSCTIEIYDDGDGMSKQEILEKWMVIGNDNRLVNNKTKKGKAVWGEKGIGRMACQKLGSQLEMVTVKSSNQIEMSFDWTEFEKPGITVEQITFPLTESSGSGKEAGTTLLISKTRTKWSDKKIEELKMEISQFVSMDSIDDAEIVVFNESKKEVVGSSYSKHIKRFTDGAPFKISAEFSKSKKLTVKILSQVGRRGEWEKQEVMRDFTKSVSGPFTADIYHFPRAPAKNKNATIEKYYLNKFQNKMGYDTVEDFLQKNFGVYLYRDDAWMKPYGRENDWLGLESKARQDSSKIGLKQVYGIIRMSKVDNPEIKPSSHRESLAKNEALEDLEIIMTEVFEIIKNYMIKWKETDNRVRQEEMGASTEDPTETIGELVKSAKKEILHELSPTKKTRANKILDAVNEMALRKDEAHAKEIEDIGEVTNFEKNLATLGLTTSFMAREVTKPLSENMEIVKEGEKMMEKFEKTKQLSTEEMKRSWEMIENMTDNQQKMLKFMKFVNVLSLHISKSISSNKRHSQINVLNCWETVSEGFESRKKELEIEIIDDWENNKRKQELIIKMDRIDLECILANLYTNSIDSLEKVKDRKRKVTFRYWYEDNTFCIDFIDNGRGIPKSKLKEVFEPFKFGHNLDNDEKHGHGLGLYIVSAIVKQYDGMVSAIEVSNGAKISLRFPGIPKVS